jgi:hypothetical protein
MGYLEGGAFSPSFKIGDILGKSSKQRRKQFVQMQAQEFAHEERTVEQQRRARALEQMRARVVVKAEELDREALRAAAIMRRVRELLSERILTGDAILAQAETETAELEVAVVQIQAGTLIDAASDDTGVLADPRGSRTSCWSGSL